MSENLTRTESIRLLPSQMNDLRERFAATESKVYEVKEAVARIEQNQSNDKELMTNFIQKMDKWSESTVLRINKLENDSSNTKGRWSGMAIIAALSGGVGAYLSKIFGSSNP